MLHDLLLTAHVAAGALGLLAGPVAVAAALRPRPARWHRCLGRTYQVCCAVLCSTTLALVVLDPGLWPFALIAGATQVGAAASVVVRRRRRPGWLRAHVRLAMGSWVSFLTAFVVQSAGGLWWVVPVLLGSSAVAVTTARAGRDGADVPLRTGPDLTAVPA